MHTKAAPQHERKLAPRGVRLVVVVCKGLYRAHWRDDEHFKSREDQVPARDPSLRLEPRGGAGEGQDTLPRRAKTSVVVRRLAAEGSKKKRKKKATNGNNKTLRASRLSFKSVRLVRVVKAEKVVVV